MVTYNCISTSATMIDLLSIRIYRYQKLIVIGSTTRVFLVMKLSLDAQFHHSRSHHETCVSRLEFEYKIRKYTFVYRSASLQNGTDYFNIKPYTRKTGKRSSKPGFCIKIYLIPMSVEI